jgi:hypothetical protein
VYRSISDLSDFGMDEDPENIILGRDAAEDYRRQRQLAVHGKSALLEELRNAARPSEVTRKRIAAIARAYSNGQAVLRTVKFKELRFTRAELEEEIAQLLAKQSNHCALTGYKFQRGEKNPHLRLGLDRIDSDLGYVPENLHVVTRAANFSKSASDSSDGALKEEALFRMAVAIQKRRSVAA